MEPISTTAIISAIWSQAVKPVVKSIEKEYGESVKNKLKIGVKKVLSKMPFTKSEIKLIETEVLEAEKDILVDEKKFLEFFQKTRQINDIIIKVNDIKVKKGIGYIEKQNAPIYFN